MTGESEQREVVAEGGRSLRVTDPLLGNETLTPVKEEESK
jgi:hypothetical protein